MKKIISLLLVFMLCLPLGACSNSSDTDVPNAETEETSKDMSDPENWLIKTDGDAYPIFKQIAVNECCEHSRVKKLLGFEIGDYELVDLHKPGFPYEKTENFTYPDGPENPTAQFDIKGTYYPQDAYGDMGDKEYFRMSIMVDLVTGEGWIHSSDIGSWLNS